MHLELTALHLAVQVVIYAIPIRQEQPFVLFDGQEALIKVFEPFFPKGHRCLQICPPSVLRNTAILLLDLGELGWNGDTRTSLIPDLLAHDSVPDRRCEVREG